MKRSPGLKSRQNDSNNNIIASRTVKGDRYVERRLFILESEFLIRPNGGTGDCMFKAVCQAVFGDELRHSEIRLKIVEFIITFRWDKFKQSIEIQHIQGNNNLTKRWKSDPVKTYRKYMINNGTLGSSSELHAAGELFKYNFATIQEYLQEDDKRAYRVENCYLFNDPEIPFYYFFFTGDFDNGHWEFLDLMPSETERALTLTPTARCRGVIADGLYSGDCKIFIEGSEISVEDWLKIHTDNTNDVFQLKHSPYRILGKKTSNPFEWNEFDFQPDRSVTLSNEAYRISRYRRTDLFSVLAYTIFSDMNPNDEAVIDNLEDQVLKYRLNNVNMLNYKLITQPHSHGFDIVNLKYLSMPCKGNIQDLLSAADIFGFSFQVFIKVSRNQEEKSCRFVHVDRWGGASDKMEYFFMRVISSSEPDSLYAKWWHLNPLADEKDVNQVGDGAVNSDMTFDVPVDNNNNSLASKPSYTVVKHKAEELELVKKADFSETEGDSENETKNHTRNIPRNDTDNGYSPNPDENDHLPVQEIPIHTQNLNQTQPQSEFEEELKDLPKKFKTVVELFDEKSQKRKKYVYDGFIPKANVLKALHLKGYIKKVSELDSVDEDEGGEISVVKVSSSEPRIKHEGETILEDLDLNQNELLADSDDEPIEGTNEPVVLINSKPKSSSAMALVDAESMERVSKFLRLHYRVAPYAVNRPEEEVQTDHKKSWFQKLVGCFCSVCSKNDS